MPTEQDDYDYNFSKPLLEPMKKKERFDDDLRGFPPSRTSIGGLDGILFFSGSADRVITKLDKERPELRLLIKVLDIESGNTVIDLFSDDGVVGTAVAAMYRSNSIFIIEGDTRNLDVAQHNVSVNNLTNATVVGGTGIEAVRGQSVEPDVIIYSPPAYTSNETTAHQIRQSRFMLREGGRLYLVTHVKQGGNAHMEVLEEVFGPLTEIVSRGGGGYRVGLGIKGDSKNIPSNDMDLYGQVEFNVLGRRFAIETEPSLFSTNDLDRGTRFLLETVESKLHSFTRMLDLGCGWGAIGIIAVSLNQQGEVVMVDTDFHATATAEQNIRRLGFEDRVAVVTTGNLFDISGQFDLIVSNPPFHENIFRLIELFKKARSLLTKRGEIYIVVEQSFVEKFKDILTNSFGHFSTVAENEKYSIMASRR